MRVIEPQRPEADHLMQIVELCEANVRTGRLIRRLGILCVAVLVAPQALGQSAPVDGSLVEIAEIAGFNALERAAARANQASYNRLVSFCANGVGEGCSAGDFVVFENVGAYTVVMKPPFIRPSPAILAWEGDHSFAVAKRAERLDDIFAAYSFSTPCESPADARRRPTRWREAVLS